MSGQFPYGGGPGYGPAPAAPPPQRQYPTTPVPYPSPQQQQPYGQPYPQQPAAPPVPVEPDTRSAGEILSGGGGAPALQIGPNKSGPGELRGGRITKVETRQERRKRRDEMTRKLVDDGPAFFRNGRPIMGVVVTVQTDYRDPNIENDDGRRRIFIEGRAKRDAASEALRQASADPRVDPAIGGILLQAWTRQYASPDNPSVLLTEWVFKYRKPGGSAPAPQQQAYPQPAPVPQAPPQQYPQQGYAAPQQYSQPAPAPQQQAGQPDRRPPWERTG